jgi:hypothetical protein
LIDGIDQTEPLVKGIAGKLAAEAAEILLQQGPQERAAQRTAGTLLMFALLSNGVLPIGGPLFERARHKLPFHSAVAQQGIDLLEPLTQSPVVNVPDNGGQSWTKLLRERKNIAGHKASL